MAVCDYEQDVGELDCVVMYSSSISTNSSLCLLLTAYCKNSIDGQWYCFDDSEVSPVPDDDVCQQTAYILFYQRRTAIPSWSANSSVAGQCYVCLPVVFRNVNHILHYVHVFYATIKFRQAYSNTHAYW